MSRLPVINLAAKVYFKLTVFLLPNVMVKRSLIKSKGDP